MSLEKDIENQYAKRESKAGLYGENSYTIAVRDELKSAIKAMLSENGLNILSDISLLEIGAGHGANAGLLTDIGFKLSNLSFNELLPDRIKVLHERYPENPIFEGNAIEIDFKNKYDIVLQSTVFTSVLNNEERKKLANKMWNLLKEGGFILWYDFIYNNPSNKEVRKVSPDEIKQLFPSAKQIQTKKITLAPPIGRKIGKLYGFFNIPLLRTHLVALIKK